MLKKSDTFVVPGLLLLVVGLGCTMFIALLVAPEHWRCLPVAKSCESHADVDIQLP